MMSECIKFYDTSISAISIVDAVDTVRDRIKELEEQMLKINNFEHKVAERNTWRRRNGKTYGRWNK